MADLVVSPYTWLVLVLCFLGGWYAKRSLIDALVVTAVAPVVLMALWFVMYLVSIITISLVIGFIGLFFSGFPNLVMEMVGRVPDGLVMVLHPATLCTAAGFYLYCRYERNNTSPPPGKFSGPDGKGYIGQPVTDPEVKFSPGVSRFRA